ncbi:MAG: hypothetical protein AAF577_05270 [Pseudomonadota bacterium]
MYENRVQLGLLIAGTVAGMAVLQGCAIVAAGAAGGIAATEIEEDDGKFDPLEGTKAGQALSDLVN